MKIGLIAMSGVRVYNQKLLEVGVTLPQFVNRGEVIASQAWNERIPGDPVRFRDQVDLDPSPAWVLSTLFSLPALAVIVALA